MKFFTPDLLERFASEDDRIALAAQEELEQRSEQYARHLRSIEDKLPPRFREMQQQFYLHDARAMTPWAASRDRPFPSSSKARPFPSYWLALQLDTPPREFLVLHYRRVMREEMNWPLEPGENLSPYLEWQHDEVELVPSDQGFEVCHSILFTKGYELRLRFRDFDFATLKPLAVPAECMKADVGHP